MQSPRPPPGQLRRDRSRSTTDETEGFAALRRPTTSHSVLVTGRRKRSTTRNPSGTRYSGSTEVPIPFSSMDRSARRSGAITDGVGSRRRVCLA